MQIQQIISKINNVKDLREISFDNIKGNITNESLLFEMDKNSGKVRLFKFLYAVDNCEVLGFISIPKNIDFTKKYRTIFALRGGSREFGAIKIGYFYNPNSYFSWFSTDEEFITISTQYRGNAGGTGVDEFGGSDLNDVKMLYEIVKQISFCDSERIGVFGWSRGAQMIYQLLRTEEWIKTAVCVAGPTDHLRTINENLRPEWKEHLTKMFGGAEKDIKERSAVYWPDKIKNVPILIVHGNKDDRVDVRDSLDIHPKLPQSVIKIFEEGDHDLIPFRSEIKKLSLDWFEKYL